MSRFSIPYFLVFLDGVGVLLIVLAVLTATGTDLGLPALTTLWPYLLGLGVLLMVPMMVWVVQLALRRSRED